MGELAMTHKMILSVHNVETIKTLVKNHNVLAITNENDELYIAGVGISGKILVYSNEKNDDGKKIKEINLKDIKEIVLE